MDPSVRVVAPALKQSSFSLISLTYSYKLSEGYGMAQGK